MTIEECIDLVTPEADRQPCARCSVLPSHAAAEALPIDLTADTPPPVSARGIADDENDRRGSSRDARERAIEHLALTRIHTSLRTSNQFIIVAEEKEIALATPIQRQGEFE